MLTPFLRRLALKTGFVDEPASGKRHTEPTAYLGGVAIMAGVAVAVIAFGRPNVELGLLCAGALVLGAMGLVDDNVTLPPGLRLLAEVAAAVGAASLGITVHMTGLAVPDFLLTIVWIVGITNALNLLDNMDGLAGGVAAVAAVAVLVIAAGGGQHAVMLVAAALAGACAAFLLYNRRPASIYMGDAGSLFLGFVLAVITIEMSPALRTPDSFAVPVMLLAVAVLDTTVVTFGRLRHGRAVSQGGQDHLSHRLVARGLTMGVAVWLLVAAEAMAATLAVLAGRNVVPVPLAAGGVLVTVAVLVAATWRAEVYTTPVIRLRGRLVDRRDLDRRPGTRQPQLLDADSRR